MNNQTKINELSSEIQKLQSENDELMGHLEGYKISYEEQVRQNKKMWKRIKNLREYNSELHGKLLNTEEILKNTKNQNDEMIDVLLQLKESCSVVAKFEIKNIGLNNGELESLQNINPSMFFYINIIIIINMMMVFLSDSNPEIRNINNNNNNKNYKIISQSVPAYPPSPPSLETNQRRRRTTTTTTTTTTKERNNSFDDSTTTKKTKKKDRNNKINRISKLNVNDKKNQNKINGMLFMKFKTKILVYNK